MERLPKVKIGPDPVYDEEFELDDIPPDVLTVSVTVFNKVAPEVV